MFVYNDSVRKIFEDKIDLNYYLSSDFPEYMNYLNLYSFK